MTAIFLSYSSADVDDAIRVHDALVARGYTSIFRDKDPDHGIPPGAKWLAELFGNIDRADVVVFLASAAALASAWCQTELAYAVSRGTYIVQVNKESVGAHSLLRDRQAIGPADDVAELVDRLTDGLVSMGHAAGDAFSWDPNVSPYPGLRRLTEDDAAVLFGRDPERMAILNRLAQPEPRSILIVGPSGSGKSSLVRAGVLPRLRTQTGTTLLPVVEPGADPLGRIALAFESVDSKVDAQSIVSDPNGFRKAVDQLLVAGDSRVVVFLDQAEDLISRAPRDQVAGLAKGLAEIDRGRVVAIFALRSASLDAWLRDPILASLTPDDPIWVRPLDEVALREVIVMPARLAGIRFEPPELVDRIIAGTGDGRALPLLAALLEELARGHTRDSPAVITTERYEEVGPVRRIIQRRAAAAIDDLRAELGVDEASAVNAYLRLVEIDSDGQPIRSEVAVDDLSPDDLAILAAFERQRLVTRDRRTLAPILAPSSADAPA